MATVVITFRNDAHGHRLRSLVTVLRWHVQTHDYPIILVEQDQSSQLFDIELPTRVHHLFAWNPGAFNKSWGMNIGAKSSKEDVLVFADADNFLKESLRDSVDLCSGNYPFIKPYRHCVDLNQKQSEFITDQKEFVEGFDKIDAGEQRENSGEVFSPCSGTFVIRSALFDQIGGWDERFVGWGGEDDALSFKLQRRRTPTLELADNVAFHLWHPRAVRDASEYQGNQTLWSRYQSYSDAQLDWLGELQRQGNANLNRYR